MPVADGRGGRKRYAGFMSPAVRLGHGPAVLTGVHVQNE